MKSMCYAILGSVVFAGSVDLASAQSGAPVAPLTPSVQEQEIEVFERSFQFIGPRGGARDMGIDSWELSPNMLMRMADELQLTPAQQGQIAELMATQRPTMRKLREEMRQQSRELRETGPQDNDFDTRSQATAARIGALSAQMVEQGAALRKGVWAILTPEQRVELGQRQQKMRERMQQRRERLQDRRDGRPSGNERRGMRGSGDGEGKRRVIIRERRLQGQDDD